MELSNETSKSVIKLESKDVIIKNNKHILKK